MSVPREPKKNHQPKVSIFIGGLISFLSFLTLVLIVLKFFGLIDCSWGLVFSPVWLPISLIFGTIAIVAMIAFVVLFVRSVKQ
jgi:NAD/NADP transhydrogenase beta subunit